jgi:hypothetical protein
MGVGDQDRVGIREACPDAIQQVLGCILLAQVGEVGAGGHLDLAVLHDDDRQ